MTARYVVGDVFDVMAKLPDGSVDVVVTSPPFLALRSYLPADHPNKSKEIGSEATPAEFIDTMLRLTAEWRRLLAPHGSICVELGDTYSGSGGAGGDYREGGWRDGQEKFAGSGSKFRVDNTSQNIHGDVRIGGQDGQRTIPATVAIPKPGTNSRMQSGSGWPMAKSLALTPELYRVALAYGINPLTGEQSPAGVWRVRNVVRWVRPNPPVGALGDKFRPATSDLVVATIASDRFFDLDAVREPSEHTERPRRRQSEPAMTRGGTMGRGGNWGAFPNVESTHPAGAPPLDWWEISPGGYRGAHYAVWPPELLTRPIKAMCPERVCRVCGKPSRRIAENGEPIDARPVKTKGGTREERKGRATVVQATGVSSSYANVTTVGWTDCGHDDWRPGVVLDPFAGSGTTLMVATGHGRDAIGVDLDARNVALAQARVGMFLTVEYLNEAGTEADSPRNTFLGEDSEGG